MSQVLKQIKLNTEYSFLDFTPFRIGGELVVEIDGLSVTFDVSAGYDVETYEDYDGYPTTEYGEIYDISLEVQEAWTLDENNDPCNTVDYELNLEDLPALIQLVEDLYSSTEPDTGELTKEYKLVIGGY